MSLRWANQVRMFGANIEAVHSKMAAAMSLRDSEGPAKFQWTDSV